MFSNLLVVGANVLVSLGVALAIIPDNQYILVSLLVLGAGWLIACGIWGLTTDELVGMECSDDMK